MTGGRGYLSLVLVGMCHTEFECRSIQIPIFQEKVNHSYTNQSKFGPNFEQKLPDFSKFFSNFSQFWLNLRGKNYTCRVTCITPHKHQFGQVP